MRIHQFVAVLTASIVACAPERSPSPVPHDGTSGMGRDAAVHTNRQAPTIAFGDSVVYSNDMTDGLLYRVTVRWATHMDTIPDILVEDLPVLGTDGRVYGIRWDENEAAGLFMYDPATHRTTRLPNPDGWWASGTPAVAPDGRHVAYLARTGESTGEARIAAVPSARVIYYGPEADLLASDAGIDQIAWADADHFEIRIQLEKPLSAIQRVRGAIDGARVLVDTLTSSAN